jgi:hypothetical protein
MEICSQQLCGLRRLLTRYRLRSSSEAIISMTKMNANVRRLTKNYNSYKEEYGKKIKASWTSFKEVPADIRCTLS